MDKNSDRDKMEEQNRVTEEEPDLVPGGKIYQYFTKQKHRMLTNNLNRAAMFIIVASIVLLIAKPLVIGTGQSLYCMECRSCLAVGDDCPVNIEPADMVIAAQTSDYRTFIEAGGLTCIRCGECVEHCIADIDIPSVAGTMQERTMEAIHKGNIPTDLLVEAIEEDNIGPDYIDEVKEYLDEQGVDIQ